VADYYMATFPLHADLSVVGVFDRDANRQAQFTRFHGLPGYREYAELLDDERVDIVVNLTSPRSHRDVSEAALEAHKHVYSEKPLAMSFSDARALAELADRHTRHLSAAPCSILGETAQTIWRALRTGTIGTPRLVYAEMDEGMVFRMPHHRWRSQSGAPWPSRDEFEVGTTIEHAGYVVSWLPALFGAATTVSGFSACVFPDKGRGAPLLVESADLAVACITFESGVIVRLTASLIAPHDHSLQIVGDRGVVSTTDTWNYTSPVTVRRWFPVKGRYVEQPFGKRFPLVAKGQRYRYRGTQQMDFARGVADLAGAISSDRRPRLSTQYSLHVNEIVMAVNAVTPAKPYTMTTAPGPIEPMLWATARRRRRLLRR
jgi:predicted dehydrogenase